MTQRFTMDRKSFEQFLSVISMFEELRKQTAYRQALKDPNQPLINLLHLRRAICADKIDMDSALSAAVKLALSAAGASSAGIWLFRSADEFSCCGRVGPIYDPERLGVDILAHLATSAETQFEFGAFAQRLSKTSHYPGYPNSVCVAALHLNEKVAGAVAAFSMDFGAFSRRDLENLQLLAGLFEQVLQKATRLGYRKAVALERTAIHALLEDMRPRLGELEKQLRARSISPAPAFEVIDDQSAPVEISPPVAPFFNPLSVPVDPKVAEDVSLPGIGVRAALGDVPQYTGESEALPPRPAAPLVAQLARSARWGKRTFTGITRGFSRALLTMQDTCRSLGAEWRRLSPFRQVVPTVVRRADRMAGLSRDLFTARSRPLLEWRRPMFSHLALRLQQSADFVGGVSRRFVALFGQLMAQSQTRLSYSSRLLRVQVRSLRRGLRQWWTDATALVAQQRMTMRIASRRQQTAISSSAEATGRALKGAGVALAATALVARRSTVTLLQGAGTRMPRPQLNRRALGRSASALAVLLIMAGFVELQVHNSFRSNRVSAATGAQTAPLPSNSRFPLAPTTVEHQARLDATSHLDITDSAVEDELHQMTRYEIATLERAAQYGDDEAAFELGMAYETGYYLRQNCSKAAHWVKIAAENGNPAAEYNLGLRYRGGDGVSADRTTAQHWLKLASAQRYSRAKLASALAR
ncbi:MAG: sel1 repeat family protein [Acidobacteria bacterium]|nr:sel1 repeat family protein [Acidobacteriota bacterium]